MRQVGLGIDRRFRRHQMAHLRLGEQPHLPQRGRGKVQLARRKTQRLARALGRSAGVEIEIEQRSLAAGRRQQTAQVRFGNCQIVFSHTGSSFPQEYAI